MKNTIKTIGAILAVAVINITSTINGAYAQTPVVTDITALVTNSPQWSVALLEQRADYYDGGFRTDIGYTNKLRGQFMIRPVNGVFMITQLTVGTNEVYIDPDKPLPGFPSVGVTSVIDMWVNGYKSMANGKDMYTRYGGFYSSSFAPGDPVKIKIWPDYMRKYLQVQMDKSSNPENMLITLENGQTGYYDSYMSQILGFAVFGVWIDPIQYQVGQTLAYTLTDRTTLAVVGTGKFTIESGGIAAATDTQTSGVEIDNAGKVKEVYLVSNQTDRKDSSVYLTDQTYGSVADLPLYGYGQVPAKYFNVYMEDGSESINVEVGDTAVFVIRGYKDGVLTDITPVTGVDGIRKMVNEAYGLTGYRSYQVIVTDFGKGTSFNIRLWKDGVTATNPVPVTSSPN